MAAAELQKLTRNIRGVNFAQKLSNTMPNQSAECLLRNKDKIMNLWEKRAAKEVASARTKKSLVLRDALPEFITGLAAVLDIEGKSAGQTAHELRKRTEISQVHGKVRAGSVGYRIDEVIFEYHILRQVIFQVLEEDGPLGTTDRDIIIDAVEKAVNDAASEFSDTLRDIKEKFVLTLTHDLRTPLTASKMAAEFIIKDASDRELCTEKATQIRRNLIRMDSMIQDILTASRLRSGESLSMDLSEFDLSQALQEVVHDFSLENPGRIRFITSGAVSGCWSFDGLRRVVENLINNALKYGSSNSEVLVRLEPSRDGVTIIVHNEGNPIPQEQQALLFEQFRRLPGAGTKPGWGIGLLLARGIVEGHGGDLRVQSSKEKGSDFIVSLPLKARSKKAA